MVEQYTLQSSDEKTELHLLYWPLEHPKALIQLIHGMAENIERYHAFALYLNSLGFAVVGHDHLGHGHSVQQQEPIYGYFGAAGPQNVTSDIYKVKTWAKEKHPTLPYFMMGHSMGSFALRNVLQDYPVDIQGAIFMGTGTSPLHLNFFLPFIKKISQKKPKVVAPLIDKLAFGNYSKKFPETGNFNWLSKNQRNVSSYENDPLLGFTFTRNGFATLFSLVHRANQKNWMHNMPTDLPILLISGADDPVGDWGKGPQKVYQKLQKAGFNHLKLQLFPELRHEILFETEYEEVYHTIGDWLMQHLPQ
ncbi:alpha/beta hydrolase [Lactococcus petauri]|uniref:Alpha/beta hydrolase n=1 Tax=Lactococcus petauri TaxID=1940789 RepID=A0AAJ2MK84_9LACT|nr:alpha/beta hydrolase [Lactococcus petauri]MDT2583802.1 alpha/beta hydrolase [Lactococcus petauri]